MSYRQVYSKNTIWCYTGYTGYTGYTYIDVAYAQNSGFAPPHRKIDFLRTSLTPSGSLSKQFVPQPVNLGATDIHFSF